MSTEIMERSNRATVLLELLKETIGVTTTIEKTTWREISAKFGELMEQANTELRVNAALQNMPEFIEDVNMDNNRPIRKGGSKSNKKSAKAGKVEQITNENETVKN